MSTVDPKLVHLVRKFLSFSVDDSPNSDHIVHCLRTQHREYARKDLTRLKRQVQKVLKRISKEAEDKEAANGDNGRTAGDEAAAAGVAAASKKRSVEEVVEDQYEKKARKHDMERSMQLNDSSMLNSSLQGRYQRMSQVRDEQARAADADAMTVEMLIDDSNGESKAGRNNKSKKLPENGVDGSLSKNTLPTTAPPPGAVNSSKAARRKKSSSKRSPSGGFDGLGDEKDTGFAQPTRRPTERYTDLGGMDGILKQIKQLIEYPLVRPEIYRYLGVDPPRGVLLRGPPGCGKTHLANAIAGQLGVPFFRVSAPELVSGMSGESEGRIRDLFQAASDLAPSVIFMDEIDAVAPKRGDSGSGRGMEKRMVAQLLTSMDSIDPKFNRNSACVMVLAATNRPDSIDPALRRAGRFDKEILLGVPDEAARMSIIQTMTRKMKLDGDFDYKVLARKTPGYVGADIRSLTKEAAVIAINRIFKDVLKDQIPVIANGSTQTALTETDAEGEIRQADDDISTIVPLTNEQMEPLSIGMGDFMEAIPHVQPSSQREGFATVPDVSWDDIGALGSIREELVLSVLEPIRNPEKFQALGIPLPAGVMLYGPPGCGKTLLAKAIAHESGANFISVKGPELLDKYVGESEKSVRLVFERARSSSPCVVFFDELDSLCPRRGSDGGGGGGVSERVVNQLLTEMDGLESRRSVFVIAATNRPELIDPAMLRPGRLDKLLYVPVPTPDDRVSILKALAQSVKLAPGIDLNQIGSNPRAEGYSGADCAALLREAGLAVLKEDMSQEQIMDGDGNIDTSRLCITNEHFQYAFDHVMPSVSKKDQARYDKMRDRMARARSRGSVNPAEDDATGPASAQPEETKSNEEREAHL